MAMFENAFNNLIVPLPLRNPSFPHQQGQGRGQVESSYKFRRTLVVPLYVAEIYVFGLFFGESHIGGFNATAILKSKRKD